MSNRPVIAYLRPGPHPYANTSIEAVLREQFPDHDVETLDVVTELRRHRRFVAMAALVALRYYWKPILQRRFRAKDALLRTPFAFNAMRRLILDRWTGRDIAFSFQIQSLFDAHVGDTPHFVYTDHTHLANLQYPGFHQADLYDQRWIACERSVFDNATRLFTRSSHVSRSLHDDYDQAPQRVTCVFAGPNAPRRLDSPTRFDYSVPEVCFVGVDWERKGGPELVRAFTAARKVVPEAHLTIVGCSPDITSDGLTDNAISVAGPVPLADVGRYLARATVFAMPTKREPFGIAFVEAMSYGLPIVATRIGALPDLVEDGVNGRLVDVGDENELVQALVEVLRDGDVRRRMGEASVRLVEERYSWEQVGAALKTVIESQVSRE